jgi:hypothetical protein
VREIRGSVIAWDRISLFILTVYLSQGLQTNATISWTSSFPDSKHEHFVPRFTVVTNWCGKSLTFRYLYQLQRFSNYLGRQTAEENSIISVFKTCTKLSSRNNAKTIKKWWRGFRRKCGGIVWESKNLHLKEWDCRRPKRKWDDSIEICLKERFCLNELGKFTCKDIKFALKEIGCGSYWSSSSYKPVTGCHGYGNELSSCINGRWISCLTATISV